MNLKLLIMDTHFINQYHKMIMEFYSRRIGNDIRSITLQLKDNG